MNTRNALAGLTAVLAAILLLTTLAGTAAAQSTDRDRPTRLTSNEIRGSAVDDTVEYYYTFAAGPGEITVTLDAKAGPKATAPGAYVELFDARARKLLRASVIVGFGDSKRDVESVRLGSRQSLVMLLKLERGLERYTVRVEGAASLDRAAQPRGEEASNERMGLPASGTLRIEMNDGSAQEIN